MSKREMTKEEAGIPRFRNEAEEAAWWFNNQGHILRLFESAAAEGRLGHGTAKKQAAEKQAAKSTTIRLDPMDLSRAKEQAEKKGLRYQTYLKMLIHEALGREDAAARR